MDDDMDDDGDDDRGVMMIWMMVIGMMMIWMMIMIKDKKVWFPPATNFLWRSPILTANGATAEYFSQYYLHF